MNMLFLEEPKNFKKDFDVVGCYPEFNGKLLFLLRHPSKIEGDTWCVPGGKVDAGETLLEAAVRELKEESGITVPESEPKYFQTIYKTSPELSFAFHLFSLQLKELPAVVLSPQEHTEYTWVTPHEALQMRLIADEDVCLKMLYNI